tara:strand:+ start:731 stop:1054 length:324 start_codon:yes stop_codon:yes gene_type:complete
VEFLCGGICGGILVPISKNGSPLVSDMFFWREREVHPLRIFMFLGNTPIHSKSSQNFSFLDFVGVIAKRQELFFTYLSTYVHIYPMNFLGLLGKALKFWLIPWKPSQ